METINISKFKATCLAQLRRVQQTGQALLVLRNGVPIAQIVPPPTPRIDGNWLGCLAGTARITGDLVEPLTDGPAWEALHP